MKIKLERKYFKNTYTIGKLFIDGIYFCDTLEDRDRDLDSSMPETQILAKKIYGKTAIPTGKYQVWNKGVSPNFRYRPWAKEFGGRIPQIMNVKGFQGVRIHPGNTAEDTLGCVLVGENKVRGGLVNSQAKWRELMKRMDACEGGVDIEIVNNK